MPIWDAGKLVNLETGNVATTYVNTQERFVSTHPVSFSTAFTEPPLVFVGMEGNDSGHSSLDRIWVENGATTSGFNIIVSYRAGSDGITLTWYAVQPRS